MDITYLKDHITDNNLISTILENLGCHHIRDRGEYYSATNPDGDNPSAVTVYKDNLTVIDYTRHITENTSCDIFDLVKFFEQCNFFEAIKKVCDWIELDYYADPMDDLPESLKLTRLIVEMTKEDDMEEDETKPLKPISERILTYYQSWGNVLFHRDNISYATQQEFEIGYDEMTNRITIPIRDEIGTLVGVKGRLFADTIEDGELKYYYLEHCNRSKILYGLYKTLPYIERSGEVYVTESEKGVLQLWSMGICNAVATGGKKVSSQQINMLTRLCAKVIILFDKDVQREELQGLADRFVDSVEISAVIDNKNILDDKESPTDNPKKLIKLLKECKEVLR